jgi:hypothetical protein
MSTSLRKSWAVLSLAFAAQAWAQDVDTWKPLARFVGTWQGVAIGQAGEGTVVKTVGADSNLSHWGSRR